MNKEEIKEMLRKHKMWLSNEDGGVRVVLSCANLIDADLSGADLRGADLRDVDLKCANLSCADLRDVDLSGADLRYAYLNGTDLRGANLNNTILHLQCPETGSFIGYKKLGNNYICKLEILEDAKRSSATSRKCRCDKARVLEIYDYDGNHIEEMHSKHYTDFIYKVGEIVEVDNFDEDRWVECGAGIHFFITEQEAKDY